MKKRLGIVLGVVGLGIILGVVWWNSSVSFLRHVDVEDVGGIQVRDGRTGSRFVVEERDDIGYIVGSIREETFHRTGISLFRMGTWYTLTFLDRDGRKISEFIVNNDDVIRKDPFFYHVDAEGMGITEYLSALVEDGNE